MAVVISPINHFREARYIMTIFRHEPAIGANEHRFLSSPLTKSFVYTWTGVGCRRGNRIG